MPRSSLLAFVLLCGLLAACQKQESPAKDAAAAALSGQQVSKHGPLVTTTTSRVADVPLRIAAQGNVLALDEVDIRPQKNGMITAIHFHEGDELRAGQLMFSLDSRDDDANVGKADAAVASAEAGLTIAERELARAQELYEKQYIAPSALDTSRNKLDTARANLRQAKAALEQAKVSRSYTRITAPFDGRAGVINVRVGSLVTSSSTATALVRLTRMDPIGVSFSVSEFGMTPLLDALRKGPVSLTATTNSGDELKGKVIFVDSNVDRTSGTLLVKGLIDNSKRLVWPGQFVNVNIEAGVIKNVVVLPTQAVVNGPDKRFVYAVKDDDSVEQRPVELLQIVDQKAVVRGIPGGLKVVLEGTQNLRPGVTVREARSSEGKGGGNASAQSAPAGAQ